jgi:anionic cell wall polymer biosynthesis LytR-Cps2A-Psr (LCP) family protein
MPVFLLFFGMNDHDSIDLLKPKTEHFASTDAPLQEPVKEKRRLTKSLKFLTFGFALFLFCGLLFSSSLARTASHSDGESLGLFASLSRLVLSGDKAMSGEQDDRINVLLLGIGGAGHDGPELTDTIMFGSFKPSTKDLGMISIPRDLTVNIPGYGYRKINSVN